MQIALIRYQMPRTQIANQFYFRVINNKRMCKTISENVYECNGNCANGTVWGTGIYTNDSNIYNAAKHQGLLPGIFTKIPLPGQPAYRGCNVNGVATLDYGPYGASYVLVKGVMPVANNITAEMKIVYAQSVQKQSTELENFKNAMKEELKAQTKSIHALIQSSNVLTCSICMNKPRNYMCLPCSHAFYCDSCIKDVIVKSKCSVCNGEVSGCMKVFL